MTGPATHPPRPVTRFEADLVRVLRFCLGRFPEHEGIAALKRAHTRPDCLGRDAVELVKDSLAKGCVLHLVRAGGWRADRFLRGGRPAGGRVWERASLDERTLAFSPHVVRFLLWATAEKVHDTRAEWDAPAGLTAGDELFFWLAFDACRADAEVAEALRGKAAFRTNPFGWLTYPGELAPVDREPDPPDFAPLFAGERAVILECLQPLLAERWVRGERAKARVTDWREMRRRGRAEAAGLAAFLAAADAAGRPDLARFVLAANAALFPAEQSATTWTGGLIPPGPPRLADRVETQRAAVALPRQMAVLAGWQEKYRAVGFFDDGYAASQFWKQEWEAAGGDAVAARARAVVDQTEPLRT